MIRLLPRAAVVLAAVTTISTLASTASATTPPAEPLTLTAVASAAAQSLAEPSRFELFIAMTGPLTLDGSTPIAKGEVDGDSIALHADIALLASMLAQGQPLPPEFADVDTQADLLMVGTDVYFRAPFLGAMFAEVPANAATDDPSTALLTSVAALGDEWGHVDVSKLGSGFPVDAGSVAAIPAGSVAQLVAAVGQSSKVSLLGREQIRGVASTGMRVDIALSSLLQSLGVPSGQLGPAAAQLQGTFIPVDVWVGDDNYVHRVTINITSDMLSTALDASGQDDNTTAEQATGLLGDFSMALTIESYDYGAGDIVLDPPKSSVDLTPQFATLFAQMVTAVPTGTGTITPATTVSTPLPTTTVV